MEKNRRSRLEHALVADLGKRQSDETIERLRQFAAHAEWRDHYVPSILSVSSRQRSVPAKAARDVLTEFADRAEEFEKWFRLKYQQDGLGPILDAAHWGDDTERCVACAGKNRLSSIMFLENMGRAARNARALAAKLPRSKAGRPPPSGDTADIVRHLAMVWRHLKLGPIRTSDGRTRFMRAVQICFDHYPKNLRRTLYPKVVRAAIDSPTFASVPRR